MTILNAGETERVTTKTADRLWDDIQHEWAGDDPQRWKVLACIHLRLHGMWHLDMIGRAFGHPKGHVLRLINTGLARLREHYLTHADFDSNGESESDVATATLPVHADDVQRKVEFCADELELWTALSREAASAPPSPARSSEVTRRIVAGSPRETIAGFLQSADVAHWTQIARETRLAPATVRKRLVNCPEFVCNRHGLWSVHHFVGQEIEELDMEEVPTGAS